MKHYSCLLAFLWLAGNAIAQTENNKPLGIGDTIPHIILTDVVNFPVSKIQLSNYKGKLLILDFWATWCGSCSKNFPKLDSLQQQFGGRLQIILLNHQPSSGNTTEQITAFIARRKKTNPALTRLLVATDTTEALRQLFPHRFLPHYVWIGPGGKIVAITSSTEVTAANIQAVLKGAPLQLPLKKDQL